MPAGGEALQITSGSWCQIACYNTRLQKAQLQKSVIVHSNRAKSKAFWALY